MPSMPSIPSMPSMQYIKYIISVVLALVITPYIYRIIEKYILTEYHGPDSNNIKKNVYSSSQDKTCYKLMPVPYVCPL